MKQLFFAFLFLLPILSGFTTPPENAPCSCSAVSNLQKTGESAGTISYAWDATYGGTQYKLWYSRAEDHFTSGYVYTSNTAYTFSALPAGHYTFYFVSVCSSEESSLIGTEDQVL